MKSKKIIPVFLVTAFIVSCESGAESMQTGNNYEPQENETTAIFAGGCFWCMEPPFEKLDGVSGAISGYTGGDLANPTYEQVWKGQTNHREAVKVVYDSTRVSYRKLLEVFWKSIDPTDSGGQFADRGDHYMAAIFYRSQEEKDEATASRDRLEKSDVFAAPIVTDILPANTFYPAEEYHQDYYKKNPSHYKSYRVGSGRAGFLDSVWSAVDSATDAELQQRLTSLQYRVTQEDGTEPAFNNEYWDNKKPGIYVDIVDGAPLFSSIHKYESGTGWPSFWEPLVPANVIEVIDNRYGMSRIEVRSTLADSHLGHVFDDGPLPTGKRYCINSASLKFIPADSLESKGYGEYAAVFE